MQQLAGIKSLNELGINNPNKPPEVVENYLSGLINMFNAGNDNIYDIGKEMEYEYEGIEYGDEDEYDNANEFKISLEYLKKHKKCIIHNTIDYKFSTPNGEDILMQWIEPDWDNITYDNEH